MHENLSLTSHPLPTEVLREYLYEAIVGVRLPDFVERSGIDETTLLDTIFGVRPITEETAPALELVFGRPAHFWLNLQKNYDAQASV